jgi:hypothetical protein
MPAPKGNSYGEGSTTSGRPRKFETVEAMQEAIDAYFKKCDERKRKVYDKKAQEIVEIVDPEPYTIEGLALALDFADRNSLLDYEKEKGYEAFFRTVKKAKLKVQKNKVTNGLDGNYNPVVTLFDLKNNHGYKDKQEFDHTSGGEKIAPQIYIPTNERD